MGVTYQAESENKFESARISSGMPIKNSHRCDFSSRSVQLQRLRLKKQKKAVTEDQ
jgi:hypothetical protein